MLLRGLRDAQKHSVTCADGAGIFLLTSDSKLLSLSSAALKTEPGEVVWDRGSCAGLPVNGEGLICGHGRCHSLGLTLSSPIWGRD